MRFDYIFDALNATPETSGDFTRMLGDLDAVLPEAISVVGNASSLLKTRNGSTIDKLPTLRFNKAQIVVPQAQGERWDFVATSNV